jgi:hypothetical protein
VVKSKGASPRSIHGIRPRATRRRTWGEMVGSGGKLGRRGHNGLGAVSTPCEHTGVGEIWSWALGHFQMQLGSMLFPWAGWSHRPGSFNPFKYSKWFFNIQPSPNL